jgi:hypothetical protein
MARSTKAESSRNPIRRRDCGGSGSRGKEVLTWAGYVRCCGREGGDVITIPAGMRVLVATKPVDSRRGAYSLAARLLLAFEDIEQNILVETNGFNVIAFFSSLPSERRSRPAHHRR